MPDPAKFGADGHSPGLKGEGEPDNAAACSKQRTGHACTLC
jgi:hypothetical protein